MEEERVLVVCEQIIVCVSVGDAFTLIRRE